MKNALRLQSVEACRSSKTGRYGLGSLYAAGSQSRALIHHEPLTYQAERQTRRPPATTAVVNLNSLL